MTRSCIGHCFVYKRPCQDCCVMMVVNKRWYSLVEKFQANSSPELTQFLFVVSSKPKTETGFQSSLNSKWDILLKIFLHVSHSKMSRDQMSQCLDFSGVPKDMKSKPRSKSCGIQLLTWKFELREWQHSKLSQERVNRDKAEIIQ